MTSAKDKRKFKVDARALLSLGRESIKDNTTALVELVKNAYDADAEHVDIEIFPGGKNGLVRISDDGSGMDSGDINNKWLRIGFSEKRKRKISDKGRRETGEKGIGRLSADRLGALLELRSVRKSGEPVGIAVDWDEFDVDNEEVGAVEVVDVADPSPVLPKHPPKKSESGTEIRIRNLRQSWSTDDFAALEAELSTLVPNSAASDFNIWLRTSKTEKFRKLGSAFEGGAELVLRGAFDAKGLLKYRVSERPKERGKPRVVVERGEIAFDQLVPGGGRYKIGAVTVELSYFLRTPVDTEDFTLKQLRDYLNVYGGVRIYRDRVRVKPYGNPQHPEGDWLGLAERKVRNPAGAGRKDYRISPNQLVGAVYIGRDTNPQLTDSAAREGLVHSDAFVTLKSAIFGGVALLESVYHKRFSERKQESAPVSRLPNVVEEMKAQVADIRKNLARAEEARPATAAKLLHHSIQKVEALAMHLGAAEREIEELASQATVYRGLATVGIASAVFAHETESALSLARASSTFALDALREDQPDYDECEEELAKAVEAIEKVAVWGQFALARVKKDKRRRVNLDVSKLISKLIRETRPLFEASTIALEDDVKPALHLRCFAMDIEALALNLLTNAYHAAGAARRNRRVVIKVSPRSSAGKKGVEIFVGDSGAGIAKQHLERIWTPLFSTKVDGSGRPVGTGLGLTIVRSIALDLDATIAVDPRGALGGAAFTVFIPSGG